MVSEPSVMVGTSQILMVSPFPTNLLKLDDINFFVWRSQILPILKGYKFIKFIEFSNFEEASHNEPHSLRSVINGDLDESRAAYFCQQKENRYIQDQFLLGWLKVMQDIMSLVGTLQTCQTSILLGKLFNCKELLYNHMLNLVILLPLIMVFMLIIFRIQLWLLVSTQLDLVHVLW
ncbi:uncharacterized protein LOC132803414 [Ziziphus jujuba]|uniref:Uncharacterized protein LOC132803414 n=1 Tax=Ziziphus jujuba TaxID=326968 RepID=A0ABM4A6N7_ZIZJJ|nr:uncharacterized protein LOC132803414 [Ziziphus jujuba]